MQRQFKNSVITPLQNYGEFELIFDKLKSITDIFIALYT